MFGLMYVFVVEDFYLFKFEGDEFELFELVYYLLVKIDELFVFFDFVEVRNLFVFFLLKVYLNKNMEK